MNFEKNLSRLEEIVQKMEKGDLSLEDSLKLFEEGVRLSRQCQSELQNAEMQIQKLIGFTQEGQPILENFSSEPQ